MRDFFPVRSEVLEPSLSKPRISVMPFFHALDKGTARTKPGADVGFMQRLYSDGFKLPDEFCTIEVSEASEVSAVSTSRSDT